MFNIPFALICNNPVRFWYAQEVSQQPVPHTEFGLFLHEETEKNYMQKNCGNVSKTLACCHTYHTYTHTKISLNYYK